jgi:hypothetical protein
MGARNAIAIDLGPRRLRAILAKRTDGARSGAILQIKRALVEDFPSGLSIDDPIAVGHWIRNRLHAAGFPKGSATIAIGREHVGLKRITLPTVDEAELADMTRLALQRELPFDADSAIIDFVPVERGPASTTVLAVAVPQPVIEHARIVARAAGFGIERISLRTMGAAALLRDFGFWLSDERSLPRTNGEVQPSALKAAEASNGESVSVELLDAPSHRQSKIENPKSSSGLAIDITGEGVEFCVVANGAIRVSRAAEVPQPQDMLAVADAVVTETRRTWMSYRVGEDAGDVPMAIVMGDRRVSEYASGPLMEMLKVPVEVLKQHPRVDARGQDMDRLWPLAGLLLEPSVGNELIDFAHPRQAPDAGAAMRVRMLIAAGLIIVVLLGLWTLSQRHLRSLRQQATVLAKKESDAKPGYDRSRRDRYKLEHLKQWISVRADWLTHATYLTSIAPPTDRVVLDSWRGTLSFPGVAYDKKTDKWLTPERVMTIELDGEALNREMADAFREALVQTSVYNTSSTGADTMGGKRLPYGFTYRLRTKIASPGPSVAPQPPSAPPVSAQEHTNPSSEARASQ